jgi:plasmid stability protein
VPTRTTLTLDTDVAAKLKDAAARSGRSFKETVNEALRRGLTASRLPQGLGSFHVEARDMGLRPGHSLDNIAELLDQIDSPSRRRPT